jgi:hypothetical protein
MQCASPSPAKFKKKLHKTTEVDADVTLIISQTQITSQEYLQDHDIYVAFALCSIFTIWPPGNMLFLEQRRTRNFFGEGSTNSVEDRGQREWGSGGGIPLVMGSTQFANE